MEKHCTEASGSSSIKVLLKGDPTVMRILGIRTGRIVHTADPKILNTGERHELAVI